MTVTRGYEVLVILKAVGTEQDIARAVTQVEDHIKKLEGTIQQTQQVGRRKLAYRIARHVEGYYTIIRFLLPPSQLSQLHQHLRLNEAVLRSMILSEEEFPTEPRKPLGITSRHAEGPGFRGGWSSPDSERTPRTASVSS